jgi:pSer/pThr/pTyr-binding forkhead associated (FHA) protein
MNLNSLNRRELTYKALAGLAGGSLGWLPVELASHGRNLTDVMTMADVFAAYLSMAILSGLIGGLILASEEQKLAVTPTVRNRFLLGFVICFILAIPANYYSNIIFSEILNYGGWGLGHQGSVVFLILGRVISWTMMGAMLGAGVGLAGFVGSAIPALRSMVGSTNFPPVNIIKGAAGGVIGGFAGGLTFDLINGITGGGLLARMVGLSLIGLAIGLLIGLVQELTKAAWVTVEAGRLKGRQYRLEGNLASIGRAEENPVGLFGDPGVQPRHAVIEHRGNDYVIRGLAVADGTFVNGERVESATLHDGDRIRIGSYELSFHLRGVRPGVRVEIAAPRGVASISMPGSISTASGNGPQLVDETGKSYPVKAGQETRIGRALDNDIVIGHSSVSRHHAAIQAQNGSLRVRDLGSQNGTFVAGDRVNEAALKNGDAVRVGEVSFIFRA